MYLILSLWVICSILSYQLLRRGLNNEFGWGIRALRPKQIIFPITIFGVIIAGPIAIPVLLLVCREYIFMGKEKSLRIYDEKDKKEWGWLVGKSIAEDDGRL